METLTFERLVYVLQISVSPVVLVSGVGLLLLSMTNRLGRVVDRARALSAAWKGAAEEERAGLRLQTRYLMQRSRLLRSAIVQASTSILLTAMTVLLLFLEAVLALPLAGLVLALFAMAVATLIAGLVFFLRDLALSLRALDMEVAPVLRDAARTRR